ncbi:autophagy-related protein 16 isoform X1 [Microplitis demolitor]|uniref:autophagy-related protein 16 isoform X1 n=1 Tax=Microplitis demolitor TaxID=69319 RepID=UPI0004CD7AF9|nr:autophagy-related protein 16 isoform X1 [Microplitis demolitor]XP_053594741.1 autophagy-related protein 16 isoform X1 [Microplitis demolitor]XP_053594742.1 autophagy-related protein 16 isoform X1 [Microplitis demolitor]XP_053594743.1 autophagy-related protein 16 isoform X1 [Microplitis demolitor]XP_053594744.1 autophagy-related protein 16 isoform X1 [Microplitis demolitor]
MTNMEPLINNESKDWRKLIINQLRSRNKSQTRCFAELINLHNRLFESTNTLRGENLQLTVAIEKLKCEVVGTGTGTGANAALEAKLLAQAEELTMLHRRRGEHTQQIVDLNNKMREMTKDLASKESSLAESLELNTSLRAELNACVNRERELAEANQMLRDEYQALQLAFAALEEKLRKAQEENRTLVERLIKCKTKDAEKMNEENDNFLNEGFTSPTTFFRQKIYKFGKRQAKVQKDLEDAARDTRAISPDRTSLKEGIPGLPTAVPTEVTVKFSAHDGEVSAVKWSPVDRILATGGADRKVKLWDISKGTFESKGMLTGSNASVMSVDFDSTGTLILGASNDFASRVWSVNDLRLRHTLTGHCAKVLAAKFLGEPSKVVTGSHDRTLKIWDLRSRACIETKFAGSSCNDLVTSDGAGSTIISGHFDKRIRFWDTRAESSSNDILLQGKVTSLDLSRDANYLLSCVRDDTVKLLDLRMKQIVGSFSADGFKVGCDWARATFSPDGQYIAVGSADGSVFIWNVITNKIETILRDHTIAVTAVAWQPHGTYLASVDRAKMATVWGDHV